MRLGAASMTRRTTFCERPERGGSTTRTSGWPACSTSSRSASADVAGEELRVVDVVRLGVGDASAIASSTISRPQISPARGCQRQADRADAAEEVVDALPALQARVLGGDAVELLGHLGVRLEERVGRDRRSAGRRAPR